MGQVSVTVIIPNYNGEEVIEACLNALFASSYTDFHVVVVDNGSMDRSVEILMNQYPQVELVLNKENLGFAEAANQGAAAASSKYLALLNNDTKVSENWLGALVKAISANQKIFSVSSKMLRMDNPYIIDDAGDGYTIFGTAYKIGEGKPAGKYNKTRKVFSACAGAALYRRDVFNLLGGFDKHFFAYLEDVDLGYRAMLAGYYNVYEPEATVLHIGSATSGSKYNDFKTRLTTRNNQYMLYKNMPAMLRFLNSIFLGAGDRAKAGFYRRKGLKKSYRLGKEEAVLTKKRFYRHFRKRHGFGRQFSIQSRMVKYTVMKLFGK